LVGYQIVNEKLPASRRTPVTLSIDDFNNMDDVYRKIYAAQGLESFSRDKRLVDPRVKRNTFNDPVTEMGAIGQNVYKGFNID
jgi:hypothetical protein